MLRREFLIDIYIFFFFANVLLLTQEHGERSHCYCWNAVNIIAHICKVFNIFSITAKIKLRKSSINKT